MFEEEYDDMIAEKERMLIEADEYEELMRALFEEEEEEEEEQ